MSAERLNVDFSRLDSSTLRGVKLFRVSAICCVFVARVVYFLLHCCLICADCISGSRYNIICACLSNVIAAALYLANDVIITCGAWMMCLFCMI